MPRVFPMIALNSSSVSRRLGIRCVERCDYLNDRAVAIGLQWLDRSQRCLAKTGSPGAQDWPDKTSRVFERKSEMAAHPLEFSKSVRRESANHRLHDDGKGKPGEADHLAASETPAVLRTVASRRIR